MKAQCVWWLLAVGWPAVVGMAQAQSWTLVATTGPAGREKHAMAYDSFRQRTVMFGGFALTSLQDTWEWDGATWSQAASGGPSGRWATAMAYDSLRHRTVLFGGQDGTLRADTWEWDGATWTPQLLAAGPSVRENHVMIYDAARNRTVLFGGNNASTSLGDTWEWDGTNWVQLAVGMGPPARFSHAMAYDSQRGRTVLFGGRNTWIIFGDTWEWNGTSWAQVAASGPPQTADHVMVYNSLRGSCVMTGGHHGVGYNTSTWEWDGLSWGVLTTGPQVVGHALAFDLHRGKTVRFGGNTGGSFYLAETWELVPAVASGTLFGTGCGTPPLALTAVPAAAPSLGTTAQASLTNVPSPVAFVALGVSNTTFGPFSLPVSLASIGMPGCTLWQSTEVVGDPTTPTGSGTASYSFAIPNNPALVGFHVYLQGWAWAPGANPANIVVSNGLDWRIGY